MIGRAIARLKARTRAWGRRRLAFASTGAALILIAGIGFAIFGARVTALRERHATGPSWAFPSLVYSDGLPFTPGRPLPRSYLQRHLDAREYRATEIRESPA